MLLWLLLIPVLFVSVLFVGQRKMMYLPRKHGPVPAAQLPPGAAQSEFTTDAGRQIAFYIPPRSDASPEHVWLIQGGNAAVALNYLDVAEGCPDESAGFLLIDYPGYGLSEGKPTRRTIIESTEAAVDALAAHLGSTTADLSPRLRLLGQSLGCAAVLEFAGHHQVDRIVLISPFTRVVDMAKRMVGWPLCHLALDRFDNRARLAEIAAQPNRPDITLFHGDADEIVPVAMGRALAAVHPDWITYIEIPGGDHNSIWPLIEQQVFDAMTAP